jgi:hypothetical protein
LCNNPAQKYSDAEDFNHKKMFLKVPRLKHSEKKTSIANSSSSDDSLIEIESEGEH